MEKLIDKNLHLQNLNGHKKIHLKEAEQLHCCLRSIRMSAADLGSWIDSDSTINSIKIAAMENPEVLPSFLQAIEWELSKVVQESSEVLKNAGEAIELCHALRAGNATLVKLLKAREEALTSCTK